MQNSSTDTEAEASSRLPKLSIVTSAVEAEPSEVNGLARLQSFPGLCSPLHSAFQFNWRLVQVSIKSKRDSALWDNLGLEEGATSPFEKVSSDEGSTPAYHREQMDRRNELSLRSPTDIISRQNSLSLVKASILGASRDEPSPVNSSGET